MAQKKISFKAALLLAGKTATGIEIPEEAITGLDAGKRPAVLATLNGYTYQSTLGSMNGKVMLPVSAEVRKNAGIEAGDVVNVTLEPDNTPRTVAIPDDLQAALDGNAKAAAFFATLSNSNKKRITLPIEQAKAAETRARRIEKSIDNLEQGKI